VEAFVTLDVRHKRYRPETRSSFDRGRQTPLIYSLDALGEKQQSGVSGLDMLTCEPDFVLCEAYEALFSALDMLAPRERDIVEQRFGLSGKEHMTTQEIGSQWGLTNERIRQITETALVRLRHHMARKYGLRHGLLLEMDIPDGMTPDHHFITTFQPELWSLLTPDAEAKPD
jgi:DNA-directed RNA polymerase specialized sigma24 family protein